MVAEMEKLKQLLDAEKIKWEDASDPDGYHVPIDRIHFTYNGQWWSAVNGFGTYGGIRCIGSDNEGLIEIWNGEDDTKGFLTAEEVMEVIKNGS